MWYHVDLALVAELVDAQHSGCCARTGVEVRVLSRALADPCGLQSAGVIWSFP